MRPQRRNRLRSTTRLLLALDVLLLAGCIRPLLDIPIANVGTTPTNEHAFVTRVIDGDTIELADGRRVRYIGVDAPETMHPEKGQECYGAEATKCNARLVEGHCVSLQDLVLDVTARAGTVGCSERAEAACLGRTALEFYRPNVDMWTKYAIQGLGPWAATSFGGL